MVPEISVYALNVLYSPAYSGVIMCIYLAVKEHPGNIIWQKQQQKKLTKDKQGGSVPLSVV